MGSWPMVVVRKLVIKLARGLHAVCAGAVAIGPGEPVDWPILLATTMLVRRMSECWNFPFPAQWC